MSLKPTAISAPGKVLLAGGFIVLDRAYTGLVFGLDARIHVHVEAVKTSDGVKLSEIVVKSPQFVDAIWQYSYREAQADGGIVITQLRAAASQSITPNPFIETALAYALTYIVSVAPAAIHPASVIVLADHNYYSTSSSQATQKGSFKHFGTSLSKTNKTGLGSSAALVTAFIASLLTHYLSDHGFDINSDAGIRKLHNLAQAAHCAAQGKVGSGFDVASAVYGSSLYRRFSPAVLQANGEPGSKGFAKALKELVDDPQSRWDTEVDKSAVAIPSGLRLIMCDVDCGSATPGMVKKVLAWRNQRGEDAEDIWRALHKANGALAEELRQVAKQNGADRNYDLLRQRFLDIRALMRKMSTETDVPIEPPSQTELLDECSAAPGVIGGVVPGAGGYDAIALLVEDKPEILSALQDLLSQRSKSAAQTSDPGGSGKVSLLGVREDMQGVRQEDLDLYEKWL